MSLPRFPRLDVELAESRYPRYIAGLAALLVVAVVLATGLPGWQKLLLIILTLLFSWHWRLPQVQRLLLDEQQLTLWLSNGREHQLTAPCRLVRCGPWLALRQDNGGNPFSATPWLHLFADQAPQARLQPLYQWLWLNRL